MVVMVGLPFRVEGRGEVVEVERNQISSPTRPLGLLVIRACAICLEVEHFVTLSTLHRSTTR